MGTEAISLDVLQLVSRSLKELMILVKSHQIYGAEHSRTGQARETFLAGSEQLARAWHLRTKKALIVRRSDRLFLENVPLPDDPHLQALGNVLETRDWAGFEIKFGVSGPEVTSIVELLSSSPADDTRTDLSGFRGLTEEKVIYLEKRRAVGDEAGIYDDLLFQIPELHIDEDQYLTALRELSQFMDQWGESESGDVEAIKRVTNGLVEQVLERSEGVLPLTTVPYYDSYTYYHSINVCLLSIAAARVVLDSKEQLERIGQAALLHDLGKAHIPAEILYKEGRLTESEFAVVQQHPVQGARMLQSFPEVDPLQVTVAFGHHIKENGHGYPKVSRNYVVGPVTAMIQVADIFEALTAPRPYKKALSAYQAFEILYSMPHMSSRKLYMDLLLNAVGAQPVGTRVHTTDGRSGVVCGREQSDSDTFAIRLLNENLDGTVELLETVVGRAADRVGVPGTEAAEVVIVDQ